MVMTVKEMHYSFLQKFNKLDSSANRMLHIPEIDFLLNEAQMKYIQLNAFPKYSLEGFEYNQRSIDNLRTIVVSSTITPVEIDSGKFRADLPNNYLFYVDGICRVDDNVCQDVIANLYVYSHDKEFLDSPFDEPDLFWREVPITFDESYITLYTEGKFTVSSVTLTYLRQPAYIHNAEDFASGSYENLKGDTLTGSQDCELPEIAHNTIVDLAVYLAANAAQYPDIAYKMQNLQLQ